MIKGIIVKPGHAPEVIEFNNGYKELQKLVEGNFEMPYIFDDADVVINEEGKLDGLEANKLLYHNGQLIDILFGNIVIVDSNDEGETISLSQEKIDKYMRVLSKCSIYI